MLKLAIVTGSKSFHVPEFQHLFEQLEGIKAYIQHIDDFASSAEDVRAYYDAILFYFMMRDNPKDNGAGFQGKPKAVLEQLGTNSQGIILLHHALLAYPDWSYWQELVGIEDRTLHHYKHDVEMTIKVVNPNHPITRGINNWKMTDETYDMQEPGAAVEALLELDLPQSMHTIAWAHTFKQSRVFCLQPGHDAKAWQNVSFQRVLTRGIRWTCNVIS